MHLCCWWAEGHLERSRFPPWVELFQVALKKTQQHTCEQNLPTQGISTSKNPGKQMNISFLCLIQSNMFDFSFGYRGWAKIFASNTHHHGIWQFNSADTATNSQGLFDIQNGRRREVRIIMLRLSFFVIQLSNCIRDSRWKASWLLHRMNSCSCE